MSEILFDLLRDTVLPYYGKETEQAVIEFGLESTCVCALGSFVKARLGTNFFCITARHCGNNGSYKIPRLYYSLRDSWYDSLDEPFLPIKEYMPMGNPELGPGSDIGIFSINTNNEVWKRRSSKAAHDFISLDDKLDIPNILRQPGNGFIIGYPEMGAINFDNERPLITPRPQIIPVGNIQRDTNSNYLLRYEMELPLGFKDEMLNGMSGGGLFYALKTNPILIKRMPLDEKRAFLKSRIYYLGTHVAGSNRIGHATYAPWCINPSTFDDSRL